MTKGAALIQVVQVSSLVGIGSPESPRRDVIEIWSCDGSMVAYNDPTERQTVKMLVDVIVDKQMTADEKIQKASAIIRQLDGSYACKPLPSIAR